MSNIGMEITAFHISAITYVLQILHSSVVKLVRKLIDLWGINLTYI